MVVGCQPYAPAAFTPGIFLVLISTRGWVDPRAMVWSEGNMSLKNPVTPPGMDPGTVRPVAQRLNHYATPRPIYIQMLRHITQPVVINTRSQLMFSELLAVCSEIHKNTQTRQPISATNAHNLYKITNYPYLWTPLHVSAINHHPQGDNNREAYKMNTPNSHTQY